MTARRTQPLAPDAQPDATLKAVGTPVVGIAQAVGGMALLGVTIARRVMAARFDRAELLRNLYRMGVKSLPIVAVTALFTGAIIVIQSAPIVRRYGADDLLGWGAGFGILREVAPLLTALMISGRVGANNTAELGTMIITEQIDALRTLAIDPIAFLVVPRFLGLVATLFMMTIFCDFLAVFGAAYSGEGLVGISAQTFYNGLTSELLGFGDVAAGLVKSILFGGIVALSSCYFGLATTGGAPGVGRAVTATVVASAAGVFALDYLASFVLG